MDRNKFAAGLKSDISFTEKNVEELSEEALKGNHGEQNVQLLWKSLQNFNSRSVSRSVGMMIELDF